MAIKVATRERLLFGQRARHLTVLIDMPTLWSTNQI